MDVFVDYLFDDYINEFLNADVVWVTGRGVDLNRNWSVDWGKKEKVCNSMPVLRK